MHILRELGKGLIYAMNTFDLTWPVVSCQTYTESQKWSVMIPTPPLHQVAAGAVGLAERALDEVAKYALERKGRL